MASQNEAKVFAAHTARIFIDGVEIGFATNITWSIDMGAQPVFVIGSVEAQEHQQTRYGVSGEIGRFTVRDSVIQASKLGFRTAYEMLRTSTFDLQILDDVTKKPIQILEACTLASKGSGVQANSLVTERFSFLALRTR